MNFKSQTCKGNSSIVPQNKKNVVVWTWNIPHSLLETILRGSETLGDDIYMTD